MRRALLSAALVAGAVLAGCGSPIVGAECRPGFVVCDGRCVDPERDPEHCGACGNDCGALQCRAAMCVPALRDGGSNALDGGIYDDAGSVDEGGVRPPGQGSGSSGFPIRPDGGFAFPDPTVPSGCGLGETECGDRCADLQSDPESCGACGAQCGAGQYCVAGSCEDVCEAPLQPCAGTCVDFESDAQHCGQCGRACASGLCEAGECADVVPGHLVVIGHDYSTVRRRGRTQTIEWIAGNALFLASGSPVRALAYRGAAQTESVTGVVSAFDAVAAETGRSFELTEVQVDEVSEALLSADAFVVHAQRGASDDELRELGQRWGLALAQFLLRGGIVVVFETMTGSNDGTYQLLEPAGLFGASAREPVTGVLSVVRPGDSVATNATREYRSQVTTVGFTGVPAGGDVVVEHSAGGAVVVHSVAVP